MTDLTTTPAAQVRILIRDTFHLLDRLQGAAVRRTPEPDLTNTIAALKYSHCVLQRAFTELTNDHQPND